MTSHYSVYDLRSILQAVRSRIEMLEASASTRKPDRELRKRIKEARVEEAVILEALERRGRSISLRRRPNSQDTNWSNARKDWHRRPLRTRLLAAVGIADGQSPYPSGRGEEGVASRPTQADKS